MSTETNTQTETTTRTPTDPNPLTELTGFKRDLLAVLDREGPVYGLGIKQRLEDAGYGDIPHARLYTNLDDLRERGLLEKGKIDERTNSYALTDAGEQAFAQYRVWTGGGE